MGPSKSFIHNIFLSDYNLARYTKKCIIHDNTPIRDIYQELLKDSGDIHRSSLKP